MADNEAELKGLMLAGLDGDAVAHAALLRALVPLLRSFYGNRMRNTLEDVEDLVQETLIAIHTRRESFDRSRPFTAWLYAVARYRMVDFFRRRREHVPLEALDLATEGIEDDPAVQMDVDALLGTLSPKQAHAIRATHVEGKTAAEAAADSGLSVSDVKISVFRGLKTLTARIKRSGK